MTFRILHYGAAAVLVRSADEGSRVALVLLALERTHSAALGGALVAALLVPHVVAAGPLGARVDGARRPLRLVATAAVAFGLALGAVALTLGRLPTPLVLLVLLAGGCCGPAVLGALSSRLPTLVPAASVPRAFGVDALTYDVAGMLGPAVAGVVAVRASAGTSTLVLGSAAVAGAIAVGALPGGRRNVGGPPNGARVRDGVRELWRRRPLALVTAATGGGQLGLGALPVVVAVVCARRAEPGAAGLLLALLTVGSAAGSLLWTWRPAPAAQAPRVVLLGLVAVGLPLGAGALTSSTAVLGALFVLAGLANGPLTGALLVSRQRFASAALRTQVFTLGAGIKTSCAAAGSALAGLAAGLPTSAQFVLVAACPVGAGVAGVAGLRLSARRRTSLGPDGHLDGRLGEGA